MRSPVNNICRFAAALYLGLMAASCSGNTQPGLEAGSAQHTGTLPAEAPIASPAALSALPSVASLPLSPREGSYVEADLIRTGEQYDQSLPNARVQVFSAPELNFMPNWQGESNGLQSTAFAVYHFNAPGYDRNGQVYLDWAQNPLDPYLIWIGLSDWQKGQWKWFQHQPGGYIDTGDLTPFFSPGGDFYMTIVAEGFFQVDLQEIRLGLPAPIIQWQASPTIGTAPLLVSFDASQSLPPLGLIEKYEWDPEGDGSFVEGDINGLFEFTYQDAGVFDAAVKVTNTVGSYSVASFPSQYTRTGCTPLAAAALTNSRRP
ncbi:PKD domain-containing protein [bacterium]|nr:PKD domain-containing protein [bacterium]